MRCLELFPAAGMGLSVIIALTAVPLLPRGEATVLVHVASARPDAALMAAAATDATLIATPAAGLAVLHGDASRIRDVLGLAVIWNGAAPCSRQR